MKNIGFIYFTNTFSLKASLLIFLLSACFAQASPTKEINLKANGKYIRSYYLQLMKKPFIQNGKKKALIIGDSHAQDFLNAVHENGYLSKYQVSTRYIPTRCQIFLGAGLAKNITSNDKALCNNSDNLQHAKKQIREADLIIFAAKWRDWSANSLPQTIKNLHLSPSQKLIIIGTKSFGRYISSQYINLSKADLLKIRIAIDKGQSTINAKMEAALRKDIFVNLQSTICHSPDTCPLFTDHGQPISIDGGHLTKEGARYIGKKLFNHPILAKYK